MNQRNQTMLEDIVILTNMIKDALETETIDSLVELYDYYRLLDQAIKATKNILIDDIKKNLEKLEDFKLYLEYYFLKNDIPKSMFITKQTFSHHYSYEY